MVWWWFYSEWNSNPMPIISTNAISISVRLLMTYLYSTLFHFPFICPFFIRKVLIVPKSYSYFSFSIHILPFESYVFQWMRSPVPFAMFSFNLCWLKFFFFFLPWNQINERIIHIYFNRWFNRPWEGKWRKYSIMYEISASHQIVFGHMHNGNKKPTSISKWCTNLLWNIKGLYNA